MKAVQTTFVVIGLVVAAAFLVFCAVWVRLRDRMRRGGDRSESFVMAGLEAVIAVLTGVVVVVAGATYRFWKYRIRNRWRKDQ